MYVGVIACCCCVLHAASPWTSGALYSDAAKHQLIGAEQQRVTALKNDTSMPLVYLDVAIKGSYIGRITMVLFSKEAPRAANNFRALCTGKHPMHGAIVAQLV